MTVQGQLAAPSPVERFEVFLHALVFVLGFSTVFVILGMAATGLGQLFFDSKDTLAAIGGLVVIIFGLFTLGVVNIPFMNYDTRMQMTGMRNFGFVSSYLMGVSFSAGWTPCTGPILGAIYTLGLQENTVWQGGFLLLGYSLGLGIPFLLTGLAVDRATLVLRRLRRYMPVVKWVTGGLLILIGVMLIVDAFHIWVPDWIPTFRNLKIWAGQSQFQQSLVDIERGWSLGGVSPTFFVALLAGALSFFSPCVLPLVPAYISYLGGRAVARQPDGK